MNLGNAVRTGMVPIFALLAIVASPTLTADAAPLAHIKGHVLDENGRPVSGLVIKVTSMAGDAALSKAEQTTSTGRYSVTVHPNTKYAIAFVNGTGGGSSTDGRRYDEKRGHVAVGTGDYRLDKEVHTATTSSTAVIKGSVHNAAGAPIRILVEVEGTRADGSRFYKRVKTAADGSYALTVAVRRVHAVRFTDVGKGGVVYKSASGHVRVGTKDIRLNKRLEVDDQRND
ncbi:hypothetical protein QT381_00005 [Galbitalea sp. SE-J8]|uniref:hypothetical protein n=1 Tax=Galbitalea sp. SE-J8 TaxID=3054952 RepID=UPI00259D07FD|nr:hypothetical protein [Galbitalea sp. SE-J8]MDM4761390.1 hypothetical protein [Galbitalea sp. SE-J8]